MGDLRPRIGSTAIWKTPLQPPDTTRFSSVSCPRAVGDGAHQHRYVLRQPLRRAGYQHLARYGFDGLAPKMSVMIDRTPSPSSSALIMRCADGISSRGESGAGDLHAAMPSRPFAEDVRHAADRARRPDRHAR